MSLKKIFPCVILDVFDLKKIKLIDKKILLEVFFHIKFFLNKYTNLH